MITESVIRMLVQQSVILAPMAALVWMVARSFRRGDARIRYACWCLLLFQLLVPGLGLLSLPPLGWKPGPSPRNSTEPAAPPTALVAATSSGWSDAPLEGAGTFAGPARSEGQVRFLSDHLQTILFVIWLSGGLLFAAAACLRSRRVSAFLAANRREPDLAMECEFVEMLQVLGLRRRPPLQMLEGISQPFVWGQRGGTIYLPAQFGTQGGRRQRQLVIAHELAHILRWDVWLNLLQIIVQALFWFHPLVWWINRTIRMEREKCCDELAIAALEVPPREYGTAILDRLADYFEPARPASSLAISGGAQDLEERMRSILQPGRRFAKRLGPGAMLLVGLMALAVLAPGFQGHTRTVAPSGELEQRGAFKMVRLPDRLFEPLESDQTAARSGGSLSALPPGLFNFEGVPFRVSGVLSLGGGGMKSAGLRETSGRLVVGERFEALHLLHGALGRADDGEPIAQWILHYNDGSRVAAPILYGVHARDWWFWDFEPVRDPMTQTCWTGSHAAVRESGGALRLYYTKILNPRPENNVRSIELISARSEAMPLLWAVTLR